MDDYTQEEIDRCLECEKPTCNNCISRGGRLRRATARVMSESQVEQFIEMYNDGIMLTDIANEINVTRSKLDCMLRRFGLPATIKKRTPITYAILKERENQYIKAHPAALAMIPTKEQ